LTKKDVQENSIYGELLYYIKIYFMMVSQYFKIRMQFRADLYISSLGIIVRSMSGVATLWLLFRNVNDISGWTFNELIFMYGFSLLALTPAELFFSNVWNLHMHLIEGSFVKYYFRPLNMIFYYFSEVFDIKALSQLLIAIFIVVSSSIKLSVEWTIFKILSVIVFCFSSSLIMISLLIIAASIGFWILNSTSIMNFVLQLSKFSQYPISIFNNFFKFLFTFIIPIGVIAYYPTLSLVRGEKPIIVLVSPLIAIGMFVITSAVWYKGVRNYTGTGS
jgi:ABC-2 type transport system permease protein